MGRGCRIYCGIEQPQSRGQTLAAMRQFPAKTRAIVAVVDDDEAVRRSLKFMLEIEGFVARTYANPADFLDAAGLQSFSCVILDQTLPDMNGLALLRQLRERGHSWPAILIASNPDSAAHELAAQAGVPIVEKPLFGNSLTEALHTALQGSPPAP